jgi:myo-inositol-1(or 4)-monophosphatase
VSVQPVRTLLDAVARLVREQGFVVARALEPRSPIALGSTRKSSFGDLVTAVDLSVQEELTLGLGRLVPEASFLGEEGLHEVRDGLVWIIDPVDGTTNLVHGLPHVAISVGLYDSGSAALGVVHNPVTDTSYVGVAGDGSYERTGPDSSRDRRLHVSDVVTLDEALASFGLPYDRSLTEPIFRILARVFSRSQDLRRSGSAALDLAILARGNLDIHVEATVRPWDCAAGGLILEEAGGVVTDWNGDGIRWLDHIPGSSVLASNGHLHEELLAAVQST